MELIIIGGLIALVTWLHSWNERQVCKVHSTRLPDGRLLKYRHGTLTVPGFMEFDMDDPQTREFYHEIQRKFSEEFRKMKGGS